MTKLITIPALLFALSAVPAVASEHLCLYYTRISAADKVNSQGQSLISGRNIASVAAIIRQDRANYYKFNRRDAYEDQGDCLFYKAENRERLERVLVPKGDVSPRAMKEIIEDYPMIGVDVYDDHVVVRLPDEVE